MDTHETQEARDGSEDLQSDEEPSGLLFGVISIGVLIAAGALVLALIRGLAA